MNSSTIKSDVVQVPLGSLDVASVLLRLITLIKNVLLAEESVVVKSDLGVADDNATVIELGEGVDLHHGAVAGDKSVIEACLHDHFKCEISHFQQKTDSKYVFESKFVVFVLICF